MTIKQKKRWRDREPVEYTKSERVSLEFVSCIVSLISFIVDLIGVLAGLALIHETVGLAQVGVWALRIIGIPVLLWIASYTIFPLIMTAWRHLRLPMPAESKSQKPEEYITLNEILIALWDKLPFFKTMALIIISTIANVMIMLHHEVVLEQSMIIIGCVVAFMWVSFIGIVIWWASMIISTENANPILEIIPPENEKS